MVTRLPVNLVCIPVNLLGLCSVKHLLGNNFILSSPRSFVSQDQSSFCFGASLNLLLLKQSEVAQSCLTLCDPMEFSSPEH